MPLLPEVDRTLHPCVNTRSPLQLVWEPTLHASHEAEEGGTAEVALRLGVCQVQGARPQDLLLKNPLLSRCHSGSSESSCGPQWKTFRVCNRAVCV